MGKDLRLQFSVEHSGFQFKAKAEAAVNLLQYHSGGKVAEALKIALEVINNNETETF